MLKSMHLDEYNASLLLVHILAQPNNQIDFHLQW